MTTITLNSCRTIDQFSQFVDNLDAIIGKRGGRYFISRDKKQSYTMNQIVYRFKKIVDTVKPERDLLIKACESIKKLEEAELFQALTNPNDKTISKIQKNITKIRQTIGNFIFSKTHDKFDRNAVIKSLTPENPQKMKKDIKPKEMENNVKNQKIHTDKHNLIRGNNPIETSHFSWLLNLGLLRIAEESATDEHQKKQIRFLATNFLNKAAPIQVKTWKPYFEKINPKLGTMFDTLFQVSPFEEYWYHRESVEDARHVGQEFNKNLAFGTKSPFILTDSIECGHLFPLKFTTLNENPSSHESLLTMNEVLKKHFSENPEKALDTKLSVPFLFDLTDHLGDKIKIDENKDKEIEFKSEFDKFKINLKSAINKTIDQLIIENPSLAKHKKKLKEFINQNTVCISRIHEGETKGIKILPINSKSTTETTSKSFINFIVATGMYLSAISLRREVLDAFSRRDDIFYDVSAKKKNNLTTLYYPKKEDFLAGSFFRRLSAVFDKADARAKKSSEPNLTEAETKLLGISPGAFEERVNALANKPHMVVLGKATMNLLSGLMNEIDPAKWNELNQSPAMSQILQASLMMIREHLATAELHATAGDFAKFAQEIELVHAEMATLLELTRPFKEQNFEPIYKKTLNSVIPSELQGFFKGSLGKTAMNTFAGINAAVMSQNPALRRVHGKNVYFEEVDFIGENHQFEDLKNDPNVDKVDLYVDQYNANISIDPKQTEYKREDVAANVRYLLESGKAAKHLTVTIDCTVEKSPSTNVKQLLEEFKTEIKEGKINFIFFNSGQKFDMLGMDHYYGSPFYMINNGDDQWKSFDSLFNQPIHKADPLSTQWFCLANKYASDSLSQYKELIFKNTRYILDHIPKTLQPSSDPNQSIRVNNVDKGMNACFLDFKIHSSNGQAKGYKLMNLLYETMLKYRIKVFSRGSFGFYHPSMTVFPANMSASMTTTSRLTPGINPEDNEAIIEFLNSIENNSKIESET